MPVAVSTTHQDILYAASQILWKYIQIDKSSPKLIDQLKINQDNATISGLHETDYPNLSLQETGLTKLKHILEEKVIPLPSVLMEYLGNMQCSCMLGIFPDIGRAWLSVDSNIYLWRYEDGENLAYFDGLHEVILSVGLIKPKSQIFQDHIKYLLCIATALDIVVLGISFMSSSDSYIDNCCEMYFTHEPLYCISTDGSYLTTIVGTNNGRIFMGGKDGCLYELTYQAYDGWLTKKCRKLNHSSSLLSVLVPSFWNFAFSSEDAIIQIVIDNSRYILYTLSEKSAIQVFDLGLNGNSIKKICHISQSVILQNAMNIARNCEKIHFKNIIYISPIERRESGNLHLLAVTESGTRMYFTTTTSSYLLRRPENLFLLHVRLPPGFSATSLSPVPRNVHLAYYKKGIILLATADSENTDIIWLLSNAVFSMYPCLMEVQTVFSFDGKTWAISEELDTHQTDASDENLSQMITQILESNRKIILLTTKGSRILTLARPVDLLQNLLQSVDRISDETLKAFFHLVNPDQACVMCLMIACSSNLQNILIAEKAVRMFFLYGGEPTLIIEQHNKIQDTFISPHSTILPTGFAPIQSSTPQLDSVTESQSSLLLKQIPSLATSPVVTTAVPSSGENILSTFSNIQFSSKHNALYLYFWRIIQSIWLKKVVEHFLTPTRKIPHMDVAQQQYNQGLLHNVCVQHKIQLAERHSVLNLKQLLDTTIQVMNLWKILCDHQFHIITDCLPKDTQNQLMGMTFCDLVVHGRSLCISLISALIDRYIDDNTAVEVISNKLRDLCPSLFCSEDAICAKANEILAVAKNSSLYEERQRLLNEALKLCKQVASYLELQIVCQHFQSCHFYVGVIDLCLATATHRDPQKLALHYYHNNQPSDDLLGRKAFFLRQDCYKIIINVLHDLIMTNGVFSHSSGKASNCDASSSTNLFHLWENDTMSPVEAEKHIREILNLVMKSDDELCHVSLFSWLNDHQQFELLLNLKSKYLEEYLKRIVLSSPDITNSMELLWKFYEKNYNYFAAAQVLLKLAEKHGLEFLSRAIMCLTSSGKSLISSHGEFLHELEEKIDVAKLQQQVYKTLSKKSSVDFSSILLQLNMDLVDIMKVESIICCLELQSCKQGLDNNIDWVLEAAVNLSISVFKLLLLYHRLYCNENNHFEEINSPFHLVKVQSKLILRFFNNPELVSSLERTKFVSSCLDIISTYLLDLQCNSDTPFNLIEELHNLQLRLERY